MIRNILTGFSLAIGYFLAAGLVALVKLAVLLAFIVTATAIILVCIG